MNKKFDYEISELRKQQRMLEQKAWDMRRKMKSEEQYVLIAAGHILKGRDNLEDAIETLERGDSWK